ncbi:MAG: DNA-binding protein [Nanoarchaeota archaeon]|nr:DNA-binding protein [Nanoarchaeota archaeon]
MDELEAIRQKKLQEMQEPALQERIQLRQQVAQIEGAAKLWMDAEAVSRYGTLKAAHPEKALQAAILIAQFVQSGKITKVITDEQLKELLIYLDEKKKETKINIQRK